MENLTISAESQAQRLGNVYEQVVLLVRQPAAASQLRSHRGDQDWSAMEILGHMTEMIPYWLAHCHRLIAEPVGTPQFGRMQDASERLEGVERGATGTPDELVRRLHTEIQDAMAAIRSMSPVQRNKKGIHIRRGEMTVSDVIESLIVTHAEEHVEQLREALGASRGD